jgi:hypothetical protein
VFIKVNAADGAFFHKINQVFLPITHDCFLTPQTNDLFIVFFQLPDGIEDQRS